jgi:hypothetical protein
MPHSSASAVVFLPFGSLTGVIPIDSVQRVRVRGDFSSVIGCDRHGAAPHSIPWSVDPIPAVQRGRCPSARAGDGGI